jgi:hypothetical protein
MVERRTLIDGLKETPAPIDTGLEKQFVYGAKEQVVSAVTATLPRTSITTRVRSDFAAALKRASLERQLKGIEPNTLQDILEAAIEPWLDANGYL